MYEIFENREAVVDTGTEARVPSSGPPQFLT